MNRADFQALANDRLADADALLKAGRYACAYYISGYAVECALKACIAKNTNQDDFPPPPKEYQGRYYVHDIEKLLETAKLSLPFSQETGKDPILRKNWAIVRDWTEETRYQSGGRFQAEQILTAINDPQHGVFQWLRRNW